MSNFIKLSKLFGILNSSGTRINPATDESVQAIANAVPKTAFGEVSAAANRPVIQNQATYNLIPSNFRSFTSASGTTGAANKFWYVTTGTTIFGYGAIQSFRSINYKAGQGVLARFSGLFENNVASSWTGIGLLSISDELSFGYNGTDFGVWYRNGGIPEVRTITVTGAALPATSLMLTLNGVLYVIPLTVGTTAKNAYEIATWLNANQSVWVADQVDNTVIISAQSDGAKSGTYSYSHPTSTGTITQNTAGVTKTSTHVAKSSWNQNTMSDLDPSTLNNYAIAYGNGNFKFYVEDPDTDDYTLVHIIGFLNANTTVELANSSLRVGLYAASIGSTTDLTIKCSNFSAFIQGEFNKTRNPRSVKNTQTVSTSFTNVLTIRNRNTYNSFYNQVEVQPVNLTISSESNKNVEVEIRANPTFSAATNYTNVGTNLVTDIDKTANTFTGGRLLSSFTVAPSGGESINLSTFEIAVPPSLTLCIAARVTGGASSPVTSTLTYYEDL